MGAFLLGLIIGYLIGGCAITNVFNKKIKKASDIEELRKWI